MSLWALDINRMLQFLPSNQIIEYEIIMKGNDLPMKNITLNLVQVII